GAMMLDHLGETEKAQRIHSAVGQVVREGKVRTYDMLRLPGGPEAIKAGAATTEEMTDAIVSAL
ncbi:MAG: isocitrate/isopropylmalate family dehydrogenase, partial [candidate division WOR-3 bacterium]